MDCIQGTRDMIAQITGLLDQIDDALYTRPIPLFQGGTLGQHFRHILGFYECLLQGIDEGLLNYESRRRDAAIEKSVEPAKRAFLSILEHLEGLKAEARLQVKTGFSPESNGPQPLVNSSVGRELMYAFDHALHHLAIIKMGLQVTVPHLRLNDELGVAPSTLKYHNNKK